MPIFKLMIPSTLVYDGVVMPVAEKHHSGRIQSWLAGPFAGPAVLLVVTVLFFWKLTLTSQYTWLDSPDIAYQVLPWYQMQAREWNAGRVPLWDPYHWGGQSILGQGQTGAAYPLNWFLFRLPLRDGWIREDFLNWYFVLIHFMGALFCYWLCRDLKRSSMASLLAGSAFGLGGYVGAINWPQMLNGAVWAPLVLLFFLRVLRGERTWPSAAFGGATLGMSLLSGHHQVPIFLAVTFCLLWLYFIFWQRLMSISRGIVFGVFAVLVGGLQILPAWEYGHLAVRWAGASHALRWNEPVPYPVHSQYSLSPAALSGMVVPGLADGTVFLGVTAVALALAGVFGAWKERPVRIASAIATIGLALSLGAYSIFHGWLYVAVPGFEKARNPSAAFLILNLGVSVLIAYGIEYLAYARKIVSWLVGWGVLVAAVVLVLRIAKVSVDDRIGVAAIAAFSLAALIQMSRTGWLGARVSGVALLALMLFELSNSSTWGFQPRDKPDSFLSKLAEAPDVAGFLRRQKGPVRAEVQEDAVPYNFGDWHGIDAFDGYVASMPANIERVQGDYDARMRFGVNYGIGRKPFREGQKIVYESASGIKVYFNSEAKPRAWVEHAQACQAPDDVSRFERGQSRVAVTAEAGCPGTVVFGESYFPGWRATVDGKPTPIREMYGCLRGVNIPAGSHRIEMRYRPASVILGAAMTGLGWLLCGLLALAARAHR